jgi:hypothetical protein
MGWYFDPSLKPADDDPLAEGQSSPDYRPEHLLDFYLDFNTYLAVIYH